METITMQQADVIGEVANICIGNAATALSLMTNRPTNITTPTVEVLSNEESLVQPDRILVKVPYTKGLNGTNLMILKEQDALIIANLMMGGNGDTTGMSFDDITVSAVSEAMNQMCGRIATSMSELLHKPTDIGFPLINSKYKTTFEIPDELCDGTDIVKVTFRLTVKGLINSAIWQLYPLSIVKQILDQEGI
jgi:flagellar motor switch protein FliN/FliY